MGVEQAIEAEAVAQLAIGDHHSAQALRPTRDDRFVGSPPLAFTFGLGGLVLFPFRVGATAILLERAGPDDLLPAIQQHRATICFTAPTAHRAMAARAVEFDLSSLRTVLSAKMRGRRRGAAQADLRAVAGRDGPQADGRHRRHRDAAHLRRGTAEEAVVPGSTGLAVPGYEARVLLADGSEAPRGVPGRLALRGPTGCRYLADARQRAYGLPSMPSAAGCRYLADGRQRAYVQGGWNITGDTYVQHEAGYFW